jgi:hypothetical protein
MGKTNKKYKSSDWSRHDYRRSRKEKQEGKRNKQKYVREEEVLSQLPSDKVDNRINDV